MTLVVSRVVVPLVNSVSSVFVCENILSPQDDSIFLFFRPHRLATVSPGAPYHPRPTIYHLHPTI